MKKSDRIDAVLFDLDGTLADSLTLIRHTYFKVFDEMGIPWGNDDVMRWIGRPLKDIAIQFAGEELAEHFFERYQHHYHLDHDTYTSLFPGTLELLRELKGSRYKTGIVTSKGRPGAIKTVEFTGIAGYMDVMVTVHDVEKHKPLPDPVFKAMEMLRVHPDKTIFIGDSEYDLQSGIAAGVSVLGVSWGVSAPEELMRFNPERIIDNWDDLRFYLETVA
ncbi:MAG: HAD family hydrolase [Bacillota bacterium]